MITYQLHVDLKSPLLIGGRRTRADLNPATDVISGGVMRAAVANAITAECPYVGTDAVPPRWVAYRDASACAPCRWRQWCKHFAAIRFEHLLPKDAGILPLTARACKDNPGHGVHDGLTATLAALEADDHTAPRGCPHPDHHGTWVATEAVRGLRVMPEGAPAGRAPVAGSAQWPPYRLTRQRSTRTQIARETQAAAPGRLYSVVPIQPTRRDGNNWVAQAFVGTLTSPAPLESLEGRDIAIGARTTSGYGEVDIAMHQAEPGAAGQATARLGGGASSSASRRIAALNRAVDAFVVERRHVWLTLDMLSEAVITEDDLRATARLNAVERLQVLLLRSVPLPAGLRVHHGVLDWSPWRGWDTSGHHARRKPAVIRVHAGSLLILCAPKDMVHSVGEWADGLEASQADWRWGEDTSEGFGRTEIIHPFHLVMAREGSE